MAGLSPMMQQYLQIKDQYQDCILFFRLGDFYEMFFEDAQLASRELELTLTGKNCGLDERAPMCGVPYHSSEGYIKRLIEKGYKVAICEQAEDPATAKALVRREVVRVVTPGTLTESNMLDEGKNNFLASVYCKGKEAGICFADISTGAAYVWNAQGALGDDGMIEAFTRYQPAEILYNREMADRTAVWKYLQEELHCLGDLLEESDFAPDQTGIASRFGDAAKLLIDRPLAAAALSGLLRYLARTRKDGAARLNSLQLDAAEQYMGLDPTARRNLELLETLRGGEKRGSLLWVMDKTNTAMGKRLLRRAMTRPLTDPKEIRRRQAAVQALLDEPMKREELTEALTAVYDMERLMTRVVYGSVNPRELKALSYTARRMPKIKALTGALSAPLLQELAGRMDPMEDVAALIDNAVVDEPPVSLKDGAVIRDGFHAELDELRRLSTDTKAVIREIEEREREKTGIKTLKIGYNRVFGYYIEITRSYLDQVPDAYIRKQTLVNAERFITEELKELESRVLYAGEKIVAMEQGIFEELRRFVADRLRLIQNTATAVAYLDMLCAFAVIAEENRYVCPELSEDGRLEIKDGRHPVVEKMSRDELFVPNDTAMDEQTPMILLTGPNMAGKSTYMRQIALIAIMTQMGSFVPASSAVMPIIDKLFTRVGASDDLGGGQSTFMVEMNEVAYILRHATPQSLVILDEIGRGTSTYDGMSIARAVLEHLCCHPERRAKTLFATHYHELTVLENELPGIRNYHVAVKKRDDTVIFLRKILPGGADRSYGIEVAQLAGVPDEVVARAQEILRELEQGGLKARPVLDEAHPALPPDDRLRRELQAIHIDVLTPLEALNHIYRWKRELEE